MVSIKDLSIRDLKNLKEVRRNLVKIKENGTAPINLIKYQKLGLIKKKVIKDKRGNLKDVKLSLTPKGNRFIQFQF